MEKCQKKPTQNISWIIPFAIEEELHVELGVPTLTYPLITKHSNVFACHSEDCLASKSNDIVNIYFLVKFHYNNNFSEYRIKYFKGPSYLCECFCRHQHVRPASRVAFVGYCNDCQREMLVENLNKTMVLRKVSTRCRIFITNLSYKAFFSLPFLSYTSIFISWEKKNLQKPLKLNKTV